MIPPKVALALLSPTLSTLPAAVLVTRSLAGVVEVLLKPFCPPYYKSMSDAVRAVVEIKFGANGLFRSRAHGSAWAKHDEVTQQIPPISDATIAAVIAYCEYLWNGYGRFPAYMTAYRTVRGFQACHLDAEFYDRFYRPEALGETQRRDFERRAGK